MNQLAQFGRVIEKILKSAVVQNEIDLASHAWRFSGK